ncbi:MAG: hypothetical protein HRU36_05440, partial [Rickettsiales bacterium]|nr:hypothetical protein [Rickettsiales bacterium]
RFTKEWIKQHGKSKEELKGLVENAYGSDSQADSSYKFKYEGNKRKVLNILNKMDDNLFVLDSDLKDLIKEYLKGNDVANIEYGYEGSKKVLAWTQEDSRGDAIKGKWKNVSDISPRLFQRCLNEIQISSFRQEKSKALADLDVNLAESSSTALKKLGVNVDNAIKAEIESQIKAINGITDPDTITKLESFEGHFGITRNAVLADITEKALEAAKQRNADLADHYSGLVKNTSSYIGVEFNINNGTTAVNGTTIEGVESSSTSVDILIKEEIECQIESIDEDTDGDTIRELQAFEGEFNIDEGIVLADVTAKGNNAADQLNASLAEHYSGLVKAAGGDIDSAIKAKIEGQITAINENTTPGTVTKLRAFEDHFKITLGAVLAEVTTKGNDAADQLNASLAKHYSGLVKAAGGNIDGDIEIKIKPLISAINKDTTAETLIKLQAFEGKFNIDSGAVLDVITTKALDATEQRNVDDVASFRTLAAALNKNIDVGINSKLAEYIESCANEPTKIDLQEFAKAKTIYETLVLLRGKSGTEENTTLMPNMYDLRYDNSTWAMYDLLYDNSTWAEAISSVKAAMKKKIEDAENEEALEVCGNGGDESCADIINELGLNDYYANRVEQLSSKASTEAWKDLNTGSIEIPGWYKHKNEEVQDYCAVAKKSKQDIDICKDTNFGIQYPDDDTLLDGKSNPPQCEIGQEVKGTRDVVEETTLCFGHSFEGATDTSPIFIKVDDEGNPLFCAVETDGAPISCDPSEPDVVPFIGELNYSYNGSSS